MPGVESHSEYEGGGVMPNTVFPKETAALTPSDKLRLQSITGQDTDSRAKPNPAHWHGAEMQDPRELVRQQRVEAQRQRLIRQQAAARYKETPQQY